MADMTCEVCGVADAGVQRTESGFIWHRSSTHCLMALRAKLEKAEADNMVLRGQLGYPVPEGTRECMADGTPPPANVLAAAVVRRAEQAEMWVTHWKTTAEAAATNNNALRARVRELEQVVLPHARKQENANGFQIGWHSVLARLADGTSPDCLMAVVPSAAYDELLADRDRLQRELDGMVAPEERDQWKREAERLQRVVQAMHEWVLSWDQSLEPNRIAAKLDALLREK